MALTLKALKAYADRTAQSHHYDVALFGTRRKPPVNAGDAQSRTPVAGVGIHSVWAGPRKILGGGPVLRRNRQA